LGFCRKTWLILLIPLEKQRGKKRRKEVLRFSRNEGPPGKGAETMKSLYFAFMMGEEKVGYQEISFEQVEGGVKKTIFTTFQMGDDTIESVFYLVTDAEGALLKVSADGEHFADIRGRADSFPGCATDEVVKMPELAVGSSYSFEQLDDATGEVLAPAELKVEEALVYENPLSGEAVELFKLVEYVDQHPGRYFLVDADSKVHVAGWGGPAHSVIAADKEQALQVLSF